MASVVMINPEICKKLCIRFCVAQLSINDSFEVF